MSSNRQVISDIIGSIRANNIDDRVSYRLVLSTLRDKMQYFLKQDADNRRLFKQANLWITLPCVALKEVPLVECNVDIIGCETIRKSIIQLPETYATIYGQAIRILNIKGSTEYKQIQQSDYSDIVHRNYRDKRIKYFWIDDNYIYIPDSDVENVRVLGFFKKTELAELVLGNTCVKPLDVEFKCPDYLFKVVKDDTLQTIMNTFKRTVVDENPDLNSNVKVNERQ